MILDDEAKEFMIRSCIAAYKKGCSDGLDSVIEGMNNAKLSLVPLDVLIHTKKVFQDKTVDSMYSDFEKIMNQKRGSNS